MRIKYFLLSFALMAFSAPTYAQSKFERPAPKKAEAAPTDKKADDKKVDISDLENRYWTEKDTNFSVVQNRLYTKAKRFSVTAEFGTTLNDAYTTNTSFGLTGHYFFSEREGISVDIWKSAASDSDVVTRLAQSLIGSAPNHNLPMGYVGVNYVWVPIYAKMSLLEKKIIYFDMSFSPGLGVTWLKPSGWPGSPVYAAPTMNDQYNLTLALDIAQQFFLTEHFALRLDLKNHFYQEGIYDYMFGNSRGNRFNYSSTVLFGFTYFFDAPQKVEEGKK